MMNRLAWLRGSMLRTTPDPGLAGPEPDLRALELANLQDAMASVDKIMDDDIEGAERDLKRGNSAFHFLGVGLTTTMRSILGFEKDIMNEASQRLGECETTAWSEIKRAQRDGHDDASRMYPLGSEYALVQAEAQLMGAMIAVLHESLTEGIKGFYRLRKAFLTLNGIVESEHAALSQRGAINGEKASSLKASMERERMPGSLPESESDDPPPYDSEEMEFVDAAEGLSGQNTPARYEGHLGPAEDIEDGLAKLSVNGKAKATATESAPNGIHQFDQGPDSELFTDPVDAFVHSGANMCFGILLLMISMVPPAFSRLLSIIGFKGDRERGIRLLWQSTRFDNINGAMAGLVLLGYYNGLLGFSDILPSEEDVEKGSIVGYPRKRCADLLAKMRNRYPESRLWRLEQGRQLSTRRDLRAAIDVLSKNTDSKMRQVAALNSFELSLDTMFVGDYEAMRDNFLKCLELNDWSHAFYYYLAGCAELEIYRDYYHASVRDEKSLRHHRRKAEELIRKAPTVAGRKKFMSKPMPLEQFISRKIQKWEERSKRLDIDFVDAIGASPVQEIVYMWNGPKKMALADLELAETALNWGRLTATSEAVTQIQAEIDEAAIVDVCLAAIYRNMGRCDEAKSLLEDVVQIDRALFKGPTRDDYALPAAHYEMAALAWAEVQRSRERDDSVSTLSGHAVTVKVEEKDTGDLENWQREKTDECFDWLEKVAKWETFVLDARIGMRVQTGKGTIRWFRKEKGWPSS